MSGGKDRQHVPFCPITDNKNQSIVKSSSCNFHTINGNKARRDGILWNELYIGRLIYNGQRFLKDPDRGRRVPKPNPPEDWLVVEVPELRIVDQGLWDKVHILKARNAPVAVSRRRRPKRLLSGLLYCGSCSGRYTVIGEERYGCAAKREKGTCTNGKTISVRKLEDRVLAGLQNRLLAPDLLAEFAEEYRRERNRYFREIKKRRQRLEAKLGDLDRRIDRIVLAVEEGGDAATLVARLRDLEARREGLQGQASLSSSNSSAPELHPNLSELYRRKVSELREALNRDPETRSQAVAILRSLIDRIVLHPGEKRGELTIELHGQLASIVEFASEKRADVEVMKWVVAGEGLEPPTRGL